MREIYAKDYSLVAEAMVEDIMEHLIALGGNREDEGYISFPIPEGEGAPSHWNGRKSIGLTVFADFLDYYDGGRYVKKMWINIRMDLTGPSHDTRSHPRADEMLEDDMKHAAKYIRDELFAEFPYKPFRDEDAWLGSFTKKDKRQNGEYTVSMFFNPAYPDGAWHNHTL